MRSRKNLLITPAQKELLRYLLKGMIESRDMLECENYRQHLTIGNASEFITRHWSYRQEWRIAKKDFRYRNGEPDWDAGIGNI